MVLRYLNIPKYRYLCPSQNINTKITIFWFRTSNFYFLCSPSTNLFTSLYKNWRLTFWCRNKLWSSTDPECIAFVACFFFFCREMEQLRRAQESWVVGRAWLDGDMTEIGHLYLFTCDWVGLLVPKILNISKRVNYRAPSFSKTRTLKHHALSYLSPLTKGGEVTSNSMRRGGCEYFWHSIYCTSLH